jgi:hypothetical protein
MDRVERTLLSAALDLDFVQGAPSPQNMSGPTVEERCFSTATNGKGTNLVVPKIEIQNQRGLNRQCNLSREAAAKFAPDVSQG